MEDAIILGFYVYEHKESLSDTVVVAWPIESEKNYPKKYRYSSGEEYRVLCGQSNR